MQPLIYVTEAPDDSGLLYAVAQTGVIYVVDQSGAVQEQPFLDIHDRVRSGGEQGLLGLAFHPDYAANGRFFVNYTDVQGDTNISEFARSGGDRGFPTADPDTQRTVLRIEQPFPNHNGGMITFGPDGYLYIGMGDGGSGGDPFGNGQSLTTLLGKMLRIDVNSGDPYGIPADNPFPVGNRAGALPEIWDLGLRNPWRWSFDRANGNLFIGDVGQNAVEEIDAVPAGEGGLNFGWNIMEGDQCFATDPCDSTGLTPPVAVNHREQGECAIVGGYVYRGSAYPDLVGEYLYSDNCKDTLWAFNADDAIATGQAEVKELGSAGFNPTSFGEDQSGELYLVNGRGEIYRIVATPN